MAKPWAKAAPSSIKSGSAKGTDYFASSPFGAVAHIHVKKAQ